VLSELENQFEECVLITCHREAILVQEYEECNQGSALVAVMKRMIVNDRMEQRCACHLDGWVL
jgi:hypothetical protein